MSDQDSPHGDDSLEAMIGGYLTDHLYEEYDDDGTILPGAQTELAEELTFAVSRPHRIAQALALLMENPDVTCTPRIMRAAGLAHLLLTAALGSEGETP